MRGLRASGRRGIRRGLVAGRLVAGDRRLGDLDRRCRPGSCWARLSSTNGARSRDDAAPEHRAGVAAEVGRAAQDGLEHRAAGAAEQRVEREHGRALLRRDHVVEVGAMHRVVDRRGDPPHREQHDARPRSCVVNAERDEHDGARHGREQDRRRALAEQPPHARREEAADDAGDPRGWRPRDPRSSRRPRRPRARAGRAAARRTRRCRRRR